MCQSKTNQHTDSNFGRRYEAVTTFDIAAKDGVLQGIASLLPRVLREADLRILCVGGFKNIAITSHTAGGPVKSDLLKHNVVINVEQLVRRPRGGNPLLVINSPGSQAPQRAAKNPR